MIPASFTDQLRALPPEYLAGGELVHAVAIAAQSRMLERVGLGASSVMVMGLDPQDVAELHEQHIVGRCVTDARRVAARWVRLYGQAVRHG